MADSNIVHWFEIPVNDIDRAAKFYNTVFQTQLDINEMGPAVMGWFPMKPGAAGSTGAIIKAEGSVPSKTGSIVYMECEPDLQPTLDRIPENGGSIVMPKTSIGQFGFVAKFEDTEGNVVALHSAN